MVSPRPTPLLTSARPAAPLTAANVLAEKPTASAIETAYLGGRAGLAAPLAGLAVESMLTPDLAPTPAPLGASVTTTRLISYTYDSLYRLRKAQYSTGESFAYTYDPVGNRLSLVTSNGSTSYEYDAANRLTGVNGPEPRVKTTRKGASTSALLATFLVSLQAACFTSLGFESAIPRAQSRSPTVLPKI